jgi:hypothetical protein
MLQETKLGRIVVGNIQQTLPTRNGTIVCKLNTAERIDTQLKKFWEIEEPPHDIMFTGEDIKCEKHFEQNVRRNQDGRYVVKMPMKSMEECWEIPSQ